jgi:spermidine synthase
VAEAGRVSGRIYAISTWGSLLGTYLPVLYTIPTFGSRITAVIFGTILLLIGLAGLWQTNRKWGMVTLFLPILLLPFVFFWTQGTLKSYDGQIFETESAYNYIQVVRWDDCNYLLLNEGQAFHSYYCDNGRVPQISVWSIMLVAPFYNAPELLSTRENPVERVAVIGLAAGTIPKQYSRVFGAIPIDGIELDPAIVEAGRTYFGLNEPNINVLVGDGRYQLNQLTEHYDVITIDAYKVPYIPWHLTTQEFFLEVQDHLTVDGVVAINVGRAPNDRRLVDAMTATLLTVYPSVHAIDIPGALNTILIATNQPTLADNVALNLQQLAPSDDPLLRQVLETAVQNTVPIAPSDVIFTDERAPVETIIDSLVLRYLIEEGASGLPGLSN